VPDVLDVAVDAAVEERQVELAGLRLVGLLLEQPDVAAGVLVPQRLHHRRQDDVGHALEGADVHPPIPGLEPVHRGCHRDGLRQQVAPVCQYYRAERGDPHGLGPARPVEYRPADGFLQRGDLLAHRRLGVAKPGCGPAERALIGDGGHGGEMPQLDVGHGSQTSRRASRFTVELIGIYRFS
jgi:hypothetical protein